MFVLELSFANLELSPCVEYERVPFYFLGALNETDTKVKDAFEILTQEIIKASLTKDKGMEKKDKSVHLSSNTADLNTKQKGGCC